MSWSFLAPIWALMGLIALPIILLYLLRQKRPDLNVSSTILWAKALADMRASTPFQKLRRNLLLLLQLLILAALVFTLMRPVVQATASQTEAGVIVIDATASMQTRDGGSDESRLDRAKVEAKTLVERMRPGDKYMLIADGGGMLQVRSGFTSSKSELKSLIDSVKASDTPSDLSESLLLAATSLRAIGAHGQNTTAPADPAKTENLVAGQIWLFSDGSGIKVPDTMGGSDAKTGMLSHVKIGSSDHNVGITRLSITPVPKQERKYQVFVGIKNDWPVEKKVGVVLAYGKKENLMKDQGRVATIPANSNGSVVFESVEADPGKLFAMIDDTDDDFLLDNTAYGIIAPPRKVKVVLVTRGNEFLERLVQTSVKLGTAEGTIIAPEFYKPDLPGDLFILDAFLPVPEKLPKVDTVLVRPAVPTGAGTSGSADIAGFKVTGDIERPVIMGWKREDPVMQYVELGDLAVYKSLVMDRSGVVDLVSADGGGPLVAYKDFGPVRRYLIGFSPLLESNWWRQPSLIIFLRNIMEETRARHFIGMPQMVAAGNPAKLWNADPAMKGEVMVKVDLPDGGTMDLPAKDGTTDFGATDRLGFYEAHWPGAATNGAGDTSGLFAVNLLSQSESEIRPQSLQVGAGGGAVQEVASVARVNREIWRWLAAAALLMLLVEWWAYHRRVG